VAKKHVERCSTRHQSAIPTAQQKASVEQQGSTSNRGATPSAAACLILAAPALSTAVIQKKRSSTVVYSDIDHVQPIFMCFVACVQPLHLV
jgi:hypothetical protein